MYNNHQEYKGFNIVEQSVNGRFYVSQCGGYPNEAFNDKGYATLNHAKGAITKYLKAKEEQHNCFWDDVSAKAAEDDAEADSVESSNGLGKQLKSLADKITINNTHQSIPVASMGQFPVQQSRNKREGKYAGTRKNVEGKRKHVRGGKYGWRFVLN